MRQPDLFNDDLHDIFPTELAEYIPDMFSAAESENFLRRLIAGVPWEQRTVMMHGKLVLTPRLTAWYGGDNTDYGVAGSRSKPLPWTNDILEIKRRTDAAAGISFNSVLLNYYRNGQDSVAWHDDRDGVPGRNAIIASVSFGQERFFDIRNKLDHGKKISLPLRSGSFLLMKGNFQDEWQHRIAKTKKPMSPRVNLTFRISREL